MLDRSQGDAEIFFYCKIARVNAHADQLARPVLPRGDEKAERRRRRRAAPKQSENEGLVFVLKGPVLWMFCRETISRDEKARKIRRSDQRGGCWRSGRKYARGGRQEERTGTTAIGRGRLIYG